MQAHRMWNMHFYVSNDKKKCNLENTNEMKNKNTHTHMI